MKTKLITTIMIVLFLASMLSMAFVVSVKATNTVPADVEIDPDVLFADDFEDAAVTTAQWHVVSGEWEVRTDQDSPGTGIYHAYGARALSRMMVDSTTPLVVCDFIAEYRVKWVGDPWFQYGLMFRGMDGSETSVSYMTYISKWDNTLRLIKLDPAITDDPYWGDGGTALAKVSFSPSIGKWYHFKVVAIGSTIKVYVDNIKKIECVDLSNPYLSGTMGLINWHSGADHAHFDYVSVLEAAPSTLNLKSKGTWITAFIEPDPVLFRDDFEAEIVGSPASQWTVISGDWVVELDVGTKVYSVDRDPTTGIPNVEAITVAGSTSWTDYELQYRVKITEDGVEREGSAFVRADSTALNGYLIAPVVGGTDSGHVALWKRVGGSWTKKATAYGGILPDNWHTINVVLIGNNIKVYVDGSTVPTIDYTDANSPFLSGRIGLRLWDNRHAHFDDVLVTTSAEFIDLDTVLLDSIVPAVTDTKYDFVSDPNVYLTDIDKDGILERLVKFDRSAVITYINGLGLTLPCYYDFTITGEISGIPFEGSDKIRIISQGKP